MIKFSEALFIQVPVIGILRGYSLEEVLQIVKVYKQEGFTNIEITMNTPNATAIIIELYKLYAGQLNIGAGTVVTKMQVEEVVKAGAQFIVSPITDISLIEYCNSINTPIFPGAYTPSEIYSCWEAGARMVKVFPARALGPSYISDVMAPLEQLELMPTGGVTLENIQAFKNAGARAYGMGGYLFKDSFIQTKNWEMLATHLGNFKKALF